MLDNKIQNKRIKIIMVTVSIVGLIVIVKLFSLQVLNYKKYREKAERQYITPVGSIFDRGNIFFTSKDGTTIAAATVVEGYKLAIVPSQIKDIEYTFNEIINIIPNLKKESFLIQTNKKNDPYEEVVDRLNEDQSKKINNLKLPGVSLYKQKWRFYPGGSLAAKTIGFVSYKKDQLIGNYGLEEYYNDVLSRENNSLYVNFFAEIFANVKSTIFKNTSNPGNLITSIEPTVQSHIENILLDTLERWSSDSVGAIVMDPYTGEIIAMSSVPNFDLNSYSKVKDFGIFTNPFVQNVYEMGSIVKPLVMASAIDVGAVTENTTYTDTGSVEIGGKIVSNFDKKGRGNINMQTVLSQSLNTGMVFVQQKMGKDNFKEYMLNRYRIGEKTGVDLPGEVNGLVSNLKNKNDVNYATASFGQGIATTPLNIVRSFASLANGGFLITPHVVSSIIEEGGSERALIYPKSENPILKQETLSNIKTMLVNAVDDGYKRGLKDYTVAAKTGTAQIAKPDGSGYYTDRNLHSLIGFFPANKPRFVIYFFNVYPKNALFAVQTLADPFFGMVQFLGNYYSIIPDR